MVNAGHDYGTDWKSDESSHWHECTCGDKSDIAAHTKDGESVTKPATEKETGIGTYKCSVCGYVMHEEIIDRLPPSHTHNYGTEWKSDADSHWYECSCGNKSGIASHIEDGGSVTKAPTETETGVMTFKCRICGYEIRTADIDKLPSSPTHNYSTDWKSDESSHWHECVCGDRTDTATHTEDGGSVTKEPTETEKGVRTYKCSVCGYVIRTEDIAKLPPSSGGGGSSGGNGNNGGSGGNDEGQGSGGNGSMNPGNENTTPQPSVTQPTDTNTNLGNETAPGTGTTPVDPGNGTTAGSGTAPGSGAGTSAEGTGHPVHQGRGR